MEEQFIPYEQALQLKQLGFNEECFMFWAKFHSKKEYKLFAPCDWDTNNTQAWEQTDVYAPLYQQAFDWFREKYKLHSCIDFFKLKEKGDDEIELYEFTINEQWTPGKDWYDYRSGFTHIAAETHHKSFNEARQACLEKLIELIK